MNVIDIIILLPLLWGLIRGLMNGLVLELTSLLAVLFGVVGARMWTPSLSVEIQELVGLSDTVSNVVSYVLLFLAIALSLHLLGRMLAKLLSFMKLGGVNRALGAMFGVLKFVIVVSVLIHLFDYVDQHLQLVQPEVKETSVCYEPMKQVAVSLWDMVFSDQGEQPVQVINNFYGTVIQN